MAKITPIDILKVVSSKYSLVTGLLCAKHTLLAKSKPTFPQGSKLAPNIRPGTCLLIDLLKRLFAQNKTISLCASKNFQ